MFPPNQIRGDEASEAGRHGHEARARWLEPAAGARWLERWLEPAGWSPRAGGRGPEPAGRSPRAGARGLAGAPGAVDRRPVPIWRKCARPRPAIERLARARRRDWRGLRPRRPKGRERPVVATGPAAKFPALRAGSHKCGPDARRWARGRAGPPSGPGSREDLGRAGPDPIGRLAAKTWARTISGGGGVNGARTAEKGRAANPALDRITRRQAQKPETHKRLRNENRHPGPPTRPRSPRRAGPRARPPAGRPLPAGLAPCCGRRIMCLGSRRGTQHDDA